MSARDQVRIQKPLLTESVMFFSEQGIAREMLYAEFEALLDGLVAAVDFADETVEAVFLQINHRLHVRSAVFFTIDFDLDGNINKLWNMPLRNIAEKAGRGPDMGGGPIRLACLGFCGVKAYQPNLWKPGQRGGKADLAWIKQAVTRNALGILGVDEEATVVLATENLQMAAEEGWYSRPSAAQAVTDSKLLADMDSLRKTHASEVAEYLQQVSELQAQLRQLESEHRQKLEELKGKHADHLTVVRGELLDIKGELDEQQKLNSTLRRELGKLQSRAPMGSD